MSSPDRKQSIEKSLDVYLEDIGKISYAYPVTMSAMDAGSQKSIEDFLAIMKKYSKSLEESPSDKENDIEVEKPSDSSQDVRVKISLDIPEIETSAFKRDSRRISRSLGARDLVSRSFVFTLVSQYDAFIGNLMRSVFELRPQILNSSEKSLTFTQLQKFSSIEAARSNIADKEIETVLRDSHSDHFDWFRKQLKVNLKPRDNLWQQFIELTERRNIYAHSDGIVSQQYINVCQKHSVNVSDDCKIGAKLSVTDEYFQAAHDCLYEIGIQLSHVLWRSLDDKDRLNADKHIIKKITDLVHEDKFDLASKICEFFIEGMRSEFSTERIKRDALILLSYCYKRIGNDQRSKSVLNKEDWSIAGHDVLIYVHILLSEYEKAASMMKILEASNSEQRKEYYSNPLFYHFIRSEPFRNEYKSIYGEEFVMPVETLDLNAQHDDIARFAEELHMDEGDEDSED